MISRSEVWAERGRRIEAARQRAEDSRPTCCQACGSDDIFPTFDPSADVFECGRCHNVFEVQP